jgi:hypothetical protein
MIKVVCIRSARALLSGLAILLAIFLPGQNAWGQG